MAMLKKNGAAIIDNMIGKFEGIVDGLDKGMTLCEGKQGQNSKVIDSLTAENIFLAGKTEQARTFRDNLKAMLTEKSSPKPPEDVKNNSAKT